MINGNDKETGKPAVKKTKVRIIAAVVLGLLLAVGICTAVTMKTKNSKSGVTYVSGGTGGSGQAAGENDLESSEESLERETVDDDSYESAGFELLNVFTLENTDTVTTTETISEDVISEEEVDESEVSDEPEPEVYDDEDPEETYVITGIQTITDECANQTMTAGDDAGSVLVPSQVAVALETRAVRQVTTEITTYETRQREVEVPVETEAAVEEAEDGDEEETASAEEAEEEEDSETEDDASEEETETKTETVTTYETRTEDYYVAITTRKVEQVTDVTASLEMVDLFWDDSELDTETPGSYVIYPIVDAWPEDAELADGLSEDSIGSISVEVIEPEVSEDELTDDDIDDLESSGDTAEGISFDADDPRVLNFGDVPAGYNSEINLTEEKYTELFKTVTINNSTGSVISLYYDNGKTAAHKDSSGNETTLYCFTSGDYLVCYVGSSELSDSLEVMILPVNGLAAGTYDETLPIRDKEGNLLAEIGANMDVLAGPEYTINLEYNYGSDGFKSGWTGMTVSAVDGTYTSSNYLMIDGTVSVDLKDGSAAQMTSTGDWVMVYLLSGDNTVYCTVLDKDYGCETTVTRLIEDVVDNSYNFNFSNEVITFDSETKYYAKSFYDFGTLPGYTKNNQLYSNYKYVDSMNSIPVVFSNTGAETVYVDMSEILDYGSYVNYESTVYGVNGYVVKPIVNELNSFGNKYFDIFFVFTPTKYNVYNNRYNIKNTIFKVDANDTVTLGTIKPYLLYYYDYTGPGAYEVPDDHTQEYQVNNFSELARKCVLYPSSGEEVKIYSSYEITGSQTETGGKVTNAVIADCKNASGVVKSTRLVIKLAGMTDTTSDSSGTASLYVLDTDVSGDEKAVTTWTGVSSDTAKRPILDLGEYTEGASQTDLKYAEMQMLLVQAESDAASITGVLNTQSFRINDSALSNFSNYFEMRVAKPGQSASGEIYFDLIEGKEYKSRTFYLVPKTGLKADGTSSKVYSTETDTKVSGAEQPVDVASMLTATGISNLVENAFQAGTFPIFTFKVNPKIQGKIVETTGNVTTLAGYNTVDYGKSFTLKADVQYGSPADNPDYTYQWYYMDEGGSSGDIKEFGENSSTVTINTSKFLNGKVNGHTLNFFVRVTDGYGGDTLNPKVYGWDNCYIKKYTVSVSDSPVVMGQIIYNGTEYDLNRNVNVAFTNVSEGYTVQEEKAITLKNTGTQDITLTETSDNSIFEIYDLDKLKNSSGNYVIGVGKSVTLHMRPLTGAKYSSEAQTQTFTLTFTPVNGTSVTGSIIASINVGQSLKANIASSPSADLTYGSKLTLTADIFRGGISPYTYVWKCKHGDTETTIHTDEGISSGTKSCEYTPTVLGNSDYSCVITDASGASVTTAELSMNCIKSLDVTLDEASGNSSMNSDGIRYTTYVLGTTAPDLVATVNSSKASGETYEYSWYISDYDHNPSDYDLIYSDTSRHTFGDTLDVSSIYTFDPDEETGFYHYFTGNEDDTGNYLISVSVKSKVDGVVVGRSVVAKFILAVKEKSLEISVAAGGLDFGSASVGYTEEYTKKIEKTITVKNTGDYDVYISKTLCASESDGTNMKDCSYFDTDLSSDVKLQSGKSMVLHYYPKHALADTKTYEENLWVKYYDVSDAPANKYEKLGTAKFTVLEEPNVTIPADQSGDINDPIVYTATVTGGVSPYTYEWTLDGNIVSHSATYTFTPEVVNTDPGYIIGVTVTDASGVEVSAEGIYRASTPGYSITISKTTIAFPDDIQGYTTLPNAVKVIVTNDGEKKITLKKPEPTSYTVKGIEGDTVLEVGRSVTLTIQPVTGLESGDNTEEIVFATDHDGIQKSLIATFTVIERDESLKVEPASVTFDQTTEGYKTLPSAQKITITNIGNTDVKLALPTSKNYTITGITNNQALSKGGSASFTIVPNKGLSSGSNEETIKIKTTNTGSASLDAAFKVAKAPTVKITGKTETESGVSASLKAEVSDGTEPYTYKWSSGGTESGITVSPDVDTKYTLTVTDAAGVTCDADTTVKVSDKLSVTVDGATTIKSGEKAVLSADTEGGVSPLTYSWDTDPVSTGNSATVSPDTTTTYTVTVTDSLGVTASASAVVRVSETKTTEAAKESKLTASAEQIELGSANVGYDPSAFSKQLTLTNSGDTDLSLKAPGSTYFTISGISEGQKLASGDSVTVTVTPKEGFASGDYSETLLFRTDGVTNASVKAVFSVMTQAVSNDDLKDETVTTESQYQYGSGNLTVTVENADNTQTLAITDSKDTALKVLTDDEMQQLADGEDIHIRVTTTSHLADLSQSDIDIVEDAITRYAADYPGLTAGLYMDISVEKRIGDNPWEKVTETGDEITLNLELPEELKAKSDQFYLFRVHDENCTNIAAWDGTGDVWSFNSGAFSTYCVAYIDKAAASGSSNENAGVIYSLSDRRFLGFYVALAVVAAGIIALIILLIMHRKNEE